MSNVYEKSLELMDAHFDSVSDEEFLKNYLDVEEFKGPLVKDLLAESSFFGHTYEVESEDFYCEEISKSEISIYVEINYALEKESEFEADEKILSGMHKISTKRIELMKEEYISSLHAANDHQYQIATYA